MPMVNGYKKGKAVPVSGKIHARTTFHSEDGFEFTSEPIEGTLTIEKTKSGYIARYLVRDEIDEGPAEWGDDSLFLVHYHRDFMQKNDKIITEDDARTLYQTGKIPQLKDYWIFKVDAYIHSGVSLSFAGGFHGRLPQGHEEFDVSSVGLVLASRKEFKTEKSAEKAAKGLIETWNQALIGDVYVLVKETYNNNKEQINRVAVGGYYGYDYAIKDLKTFEG